MFLGKPKNCGNGGSDDGRRQFLRAAGAAVAAGVAGCSAVTGGGSPGTVNVAYKPIYPFLQFLVMKEEGYLDALEPEVEATNFADQGLTIVSAYSDGDVDVAFMGITPVIRMRHEGLPGRVTAANQEGGFVVMASEEFASLYDDHGGDAFDRFRDSEGRPFRFSTFPKGSVANVLLHHWLDEELGVSENTYEVENMAGAGPVRRALLSGNADGTLIMEPIPTALEARDAPFARVTRTGRFLSGQPGGVMFMHDRLREEHSGVGRALVEQHVRATELINDDPEAAADAVSRALGDKLPTQIALDAITSEASTYISDPRRVTGGTRLFVERMQALGQIEHPVANEDIFDPSLYEAVA